MNATASSPVQSVIIPTYNRKEMLADAIYSVLKQRNVNVELIIVDDCSADGTEEFVKSLTDERIQYFRNEKNSGQEYSRMIGLRHARGKYITFFDDDDYYTDYDFFQKAIKIFGEHDTEDEPLAFVCANGYSLNVMTDEKKLHNIGRPGRVKGIDYILNLYHEYNKPLSVFPTVFKAEALRNAGLENMIIFDSLTYFEAAMYGDVWVMSDIIGEYRVHGESATLGYKNHKSNEGRLYMKVLKSIERYEKLAVKLYAVGDKKSINEWCIKKMYISFYYYERRRKGVSKTLRLYRDIIRIFNFIPELKYLLLKRWFF